MPYPLDLHMHSQYSDDGEFSPAQLAEQCQAAGITLMAVTDHNSTRAVDETQEAAQTLGIPVYQRSRTGLSIPGR